MHGAAAMNASAGWENTAAASSESRGGGRAVRLAVLLREPVSPLDQYRMGHALVLEQHTDFQPPLGIRLCELHVVTMLGGETMRQSALPEPQSW